MSLHNLLSYSQIITLNISFPKVDRSTEHSHVFVFRPRQLFRIQYSLWSASTKKNLTMHEKKNWIFLQMKFVIWKMWRGLHSIQIRSTDLLAFSSGQPDTRTHTHTPRVHISLQANNTNHADAKQEITFRLINIPSVASLYLAPMLMWFYLGGDLGMRCLRVHSSLLHENRTQSEKTDSKKTTENDLRSCRKLECRETALTDWLKVQWSRWACRWATIKKTLFHYFLAVHSTNDRVVSA